jgi:hypothetical protein
MSSRKWPKPKRAPVFDSIYNRTELSPKEFCRRRDKAFPAQLTDKQIQALATLKAKRDLFL